MQILYRPIALLSVISLILASTLTGYSASADTNDSGHTPQGQLTRRGLTGTVVGKGGSSFVLETKFGNVTIDVNAGTIVKSGGEIVDFSVMRVGDRAGVLLDRPPDTTAKSGSDDDDEPDLTPPSTDDDSGSDPDLTPPETGDDSGTEPDLVVLDTSDDTGTDPDVTQTVDLTPQSTSDDSGSDPDMTPPETGDDSGTEPDMTAPSTADDSGTEPEPSPTPTPAPSFRQGVTALRITIVPARASRSHQRGVVTSKGQGKVRFLDENGDEQELDGDSDADEGDDVIFITRGRGGGRVAVTGSTDPGDIDERLTRLAESNPELAAKITEKKVAAQTRREERLANTLGNAPDDKKGGIRGAVERNKDRSQRSGSNSGDGGGNPGRGGGNPDSGGNSGRGNSGGGGGRGRG